MSNHNKMLEKEIIEFHNQQAKVANETSILDKMEANIIAKLCPFKKGDKVVFTEALRGDNKDYFGVVSAIYFDGVNSDAIDNRWVIYVNPTTKNFTPSTRHNNYHKVIGKRKGDKIRKA